MRKSSQTDLASTRWEVHPGGTAIAASARALDGGSWTFRPFRALLALLATLALLASGAMPARANGNGGGTQSCDSVLGEYTTTSLTEVRQHVGADEAGGLTGAGVGVAVIDTGVNRVPGLTGTGKVIDGPDLSFDALEANLRHRDLHGHGTNMAAIIAAEDTTAGPGVAPGAHLVNVKVGAGDGTVDVSQVIAAIDWVVQNRAQHDIRVVNLAYDTDATQSYLLDPLSHAVENAWKSGIVVVVAGGNDGRGIRRLGNPATNPYVIAVGASNDSSFKVPNWSSTGDGTRNPDVVAPGEHVLSAAVPGSYLADEHPDALCVDGQGTLSLRGSGTSQAAAVVSGAAALLLEQRPNLTPDQVKYLLRSTADNITGPPTQGGEGRIDVEAALAAPTPGPLAVQTHAPSTGLGTLDGARGSFFVGSQGDYLDGELTAFGGDWDALAWTTASNGETAWTDQTWSGATWTGGTWMGATWTGATWSGATWSGATWTGATWTGATWTGATWSGATWTGATWTGATWSGATWSGATWSGATWA